MIRTLYCKHEDDNGNLNDVKVEYQIEHPSLSTDETPYTVKIISITCNEMPYKLDDESQEELISICYEHYDEDSWEYDNE